MFGLFKKEEVFIHYGSKSFSASRFKKVYNSNWHTDKPNGGLWASPVNAKFGWKDWNLISDYDECDEENSFLFTLKKGSKVIRINSLRDMKKKIPFKKPDKNEEIYDFNFKKASKKYDALIFNFSKMKRKDISVLNTWDCDSIVVFNPAVIVEKRR